MLYDYLIKRYELGEPIFAGDISIPGMTDGNLRYHLKKLVDNGKLCRFESGVYYIPKTNILGDRVILSADTVALHKYIRRRGMRIGYFSGYTLANRLGLSTQVPFTEEIISNYAPAPVRELKIKNKKYIVRKPFVQVTNENVFVLELLDCLKDIDKCAETDMRSCGVILSEFTQAHGITKKDIDRFIAYYPLKVYKAIYETGVNYVSTQK